MSARVVALGLACALVAAGCGESSGLRVENGSRPVHVTSPATPAPRVHSLAAVAFPTAANGWAAGKGAIIATTDGGRTWTEQYRGRADIRALDFTDDRDGWALSAASLLRTTDGGATWTEAGEAPGSLLTTVDFVSATQGWGIAARAADGSLVGDLVHTDDGGMT